MSENSVSENSVSENSVSENAAEEEESEIPVVEINIDPSSGMAIDPINQEALDPETGAPLDEESGIFQDANGNTIGYACELKEDWAFVNGKHICDVSEVKDTNQLEWDLKEDV